LQFLLSAGADANVLAQSIGTPTPLGILAANTADVTVLLPSIHLLVRNGAWTWPEGVLEALWRFSESTDCHLPISPWKDTYNEWLSFWQERAHITLDWATKSDSRGPGEHKFITFANVGVCPAWYSLQNFLEDTASDAGANNGEKAWFSCPGLLAGRMS
jgi:hypothetical protein